MSTLLIAGTVGVGNSTIAAEINDLLAERRVPSAAVDLDALVWQWPPSGVFNSDLMFDNLAALWPNYRAHGATHLVLARVLEDPGELDRCRHALARHAVRAAAGEPPVLHRRQSVAKSDGVVRT